MGFLEWLLGNIFKNRLVKIDYYSIFCHIPALKCLHLTGTVHLRQHYPMNFSPYLTFTPDEWRTYRSDTAFLLSLSQTELDALKGFSESLSPAIVTDIYLPLSRLIHLYVTQTQSLFETTRLFLGHQKTKVPYIIGISGSVAVGKSTTSRVLQTLLSRDPTHPKVALVTTDGFLYSNQWLVQHDLITRKGFPESYNTTALVQFLIDIKSGKKQLRVPVYSHEIYDVTDQTLSIHDPDILIIEGLNLLNEPAAGSAWRVTDFIDFSIYIDAKTHDIEQWYIERFLSFRSRAQNHPEKYFYRFTQLSDTDAVNFARHIWQTINEKNLRENILPYKNRARLILEKNAAHHIQAIKLRRL